MPNITSALLSPIVTKLSGKQRKGLFGIGWSTASQLVGLVVKLGSTLILTRLLAPEAYGILGTAMAVLTTLEWLSDLGIQPALIRHRKGDRPSYLLTGWMMGLGRGFALTIVAVLSAWPLAAFYGEPSLFGVLLVLAIRPALIALRSPAFPLLRRRLNYKAIFVDEVCMTVVGTVCSIAMAFVFQSVWAIVLGTMAGALTSVCLSYVLIPMKPSFRWDRAASQEIYSVGRQVFINTLVMAAWLNLDRLLGLRLLTPAEMGLYAIAFNLAAVLEGVVTRGCDVYFSMLAREEAGEGQLQWHRNICNKAASWAMPLATLAVLVSPWVIWVLYDARYHGAGLIFAILIARLMIRALGQLQFQYLLALVEVRLATRAYFVALAVQVACFYPLVTTMGVLGMALSVLLSTTALTMTQTWLLRARMGDSVQPFARTVAWAATSLLVLVYVYGLASYSPAESTVSKNQKSAAPSVEVNL